MQCTAQLVECLKVTSSIDGFPLWQKPDQYGSFSILKIHFLWPYGTRALFSIPPHHHQQCCMVLFYAVVFLQDQSGETIFATCHDAATKVTALKNILFQQLWRNIFLLKFILYQQAMNLARTYLPVTQTLHLFPNCVVPYSDLCCHFFFPLSCTHSLW